MPLGPGSQGVPERLNRLVRAPQPSRTSSTRRPTSKFHRRTVIISGVGFFTDAYDLFVIGTVATLVATQWKLSTLQTSWVTGAAILGAFVGAFAFGRLADVLGRKKVYVTVAVIMIFGAVGSAFAPSFFFLVAARLVLGFGIGGDYPVSAVYMSEYSNRQDRGRLVGLVFSMQALGLIVGPLVALCAPVVGRRRRVGVAHPAGPGCDSGRDGGVPAVQDARIAPLPRPGRGPVGPGCPRYAAILRWRHHGACRRDGTRRPVAATRIRH